MIGISLIIYKVRQVRHVHQVKVDRLDGLYGLIISTRDERILVIHAITILAARS